MQLGGSSACVESCDFWCSTNWRVEKDDAGCEVWRYDMIASCTPGQPGDAGSDQ
jgi:hypothetical protein